MDDQTRPQPKPDQPTPEPQWTPPPQPQPPQAQWTPPPPPGQQPQTQWSPPPQQPAQGWGGPGYAAPPPRPVAVTVTGIFFVIWGVLVTLAGVLIVILGQAAGALDFEDIPGLSGAVGGAITVVGVVIVVLGILWLVSGIGIFLAKQWARLLGIIMGVVGIILAGLITLGSLTDRPGSPADPDPTGGIVVFGIVTALSAVGVWALATAGNYFAYRR